MRCEAVISCAFYILYRPQFFCNSQGCTIHVPPNFECRQLSAVIPFRTKVRYTNTPRQQILLKAYPILILNICKKAQPVLERLDLSGCNVSRASVLEFHEINRRKASDLVLFKALDLKREKKNINRCCCKT